jgi:peptide/nickel transport system permease protein
LPSKKPYRIFRRMLHHGLRLIAIVLTAGVLSATLVRFAPGFGVDERELDSQLSSGSIAAIRNSNAANRSLPRFYVNYFRDMIRGQFGISQTFQRPVAELVRERSTVSLHSLAVALPATWFLVLCVALSVTILRNQFFTFMPSLFAAGLMASPAAMVALWAATTGHGVEIALTLILAPPLYRYVQNVMERNFRSPHVMAARACGVGPVRLVVWHVLPTAAPQVVGLIAISLSMAFGALIPVEFICDSPGFGQLALQAALGRDLPLLVTLTMIITIVTFAANMTADALNQALTPVSG